MHGLNFNRCNLGGGWLCNPSNQKENLFVILTMKADAKSYLYKVKGMCGMAGEHPTY